MLKKQTVNEDKIQKSKVQAEQSKPQSKRRNTRTYSDLKQNSEYPGKVYRSFSYDLIYRITDQFRNVERKGDADCCQQNRKNNKNTILPKMPEYFF